MDTKEYTGIIIQELTDTLRKISGEDARKLTDEIMKAKKVLVAGVGRSGFMAKAFTMRLMHMGVDAYPVGETVTPGLEEGDLFLAASGSGETESLVSMAKKARKIGAAVAIITIRPESSIGKLSDIVVMIPAPTPKADTDHNVTSIQPMGSLYEQSLLLFLDAIILTLMEKKHNDSDTMFTRHANLE